MNRRPPERCDGFPRVGVAVTRLQRLHHARSALALLCATAVVAVGCDQAPPLDPTPRVPATSISGPGVVRGIVRFNGPKPPEKRLRNEPCCAGAPSTLLDETVVLGPENTLANVVVSIEGGPKATGDDLPPVLLDQVFCQYTPHVVGVVVGQTLTIRSSDPTTHNVNIRSRFGQTRNFWMQRVGESSKTSFTHPEVVSSGCDIHPWMRAYIAILDNPLFAITGMDGAFEIANIPPGEYKLVTWHELYGRLEQPLVIPADADAPVTINFVYQPPKAP